MVNRRIFFRQAGAFTLGTLLLPACSSQENKAIENENTTASSGSRTGEGNLGPVGLQLYSVRDIIEQDLKGTLQQLADIGYKEVESYPGTEGHYFGMEPQAFATMLSDMRMQLVSSHFGSGARGAEADSWWQATMLSRFEELAEKAAQTGQKFLTCSFMDESLRKTSEDLKQTAALFNKTGEICKKAGLQFAYHNHAFEFDTVGEHVVYDYLLQNTDPDLVKWEMDIYWVAAAGKDPVAYLKQYPNRFPLGHVKDMNRQDNSRNTELGLGTLDYQTILQVAAEHGMEHFLVEQETYSSSPMESMKANYEYLSRVQV